MQCLQHIGSSLTQERLPPLTCRCLNLHTQFSEKAISISVFHLGRGVALGMRQQHGLGAPNWSVILGRHSCQGKLYFTILSDSPRTSFLEQVLAAMKPSLQLHADYFNLPHKRLCICTFREPGCTLVQKEKLQVVGHHTPRARLGFSHSILFHTQVVKLRHLFLLINSHHWRQKH